MPLCVQVLGLRGFGVLPDPVAPSAAPVNRQASSEAPSDCSASTTFADDALCAHTSNLCLSSSYDSTGSSSGSAGSKLCSASQAGRCSSGNLSGSSGGSLQPLMAVLAALPKLTCLTVSSVTCDGQTLSVDQAAAADLAAARRLTSLQLTDTGLTDAALNALVTHGLTHLRRLVVDNNLKVTADVLPDEVATMLTELQELGVLRTGIRATAAGFKARMLQLHPRLLIKSSAR